MRVQPKAVLQCFTTSHNSGEFRILTKFSEVEMIWYFPQVVTHLSPFSSIQATFYKTFFEAATRWICSFVFVHTLTNQLPKHTHTHRAVGAVINKNKLQCFRCPPPHLSSSGLYVNHFPVEAALMQLTLQFHSWELMGALQMRARTWHGFSVWTNDIL